MIFRGFIRDAHGIVLYRQHIEETAEENVVINSRVA